MSLATRITLLVSALLAVCGAAAGVATYRSAARSLSAEVQGRLKARLAWMEGVLDVELEDGELQLEARDEPAGAAATGWEIAATDGRVLWASPRPVGPGATSLARTVTFGDAGAATVPPGQITAGDDSRDDAGSGAGRPAWTAVPVTELPAAALDAARRAVPGIEARGAFRRTRVKKRPSRSEAVFELHGVTGGREYALRLGAAGDVLRVKDRAIDPFVEYGLPPDARRLDLVLTARASADEARTELARLRRTLWAVGPLALAATAAGLALLIRWQLRPLARMAEQAGAIGPAGRGGRIDAAATSSELVRLREAINGMLRRLAEGLERERQFASTAAHELRTPLAQLRTTVEVALRRPREAAEYREALEGVSSDVERLQKLVVGLLQLTRGSDPAGTRSVPVPLLPLLARAAKQCGPALLPAPSPGGDGGGPWVYGDAELLHAALCNVLENASRYAPGAPPAVRVVAEDGRGTVLAVISDRGPGVPEEDRERIFQPLTRLDASGTVRDGGGFGLGLAVARTAARAFGGDLTCRARSDGLAGAEFVLTLRRAPPPEAQAESDGAPRGGAAAPTPG